MFRVRGVEIHSSRLWQAAQVERTLDFMQAFELNTLVLHENDIVDQLVLPSQYFEEAQMLARWPIRFARLWDNRVYMNQLIEKAKRRGVDVFFQTKEIWYPDPLLETHPELRNADGSICPTNPFWFQFVSDKMSDLLAHVPGFAGIVVSPGTRESRVSINAHGCSCERCSLASAVEWYEHLLAAMFAPLNAAGKELVVRDFSWTADEQDEILEGASRVSDRIVVQLKNTPHDFYPTFPDNPLIGRSGPHRQRIEYDSWGQFFGLGILPVSVADDLRQRIIHALANGADGIVFRTDWEIILDHSVFNSCNSVNLVAGAMLARHPDVQNKDIYGRWLDYGISSPLISGSYLAVPVAPQSHAEALAGWQAYFDLAWEAIEKGIYAQGLVFHENSMFPDTLDKPYFYMTDFHSQDHWIPGASERVRATNENIETLEQEKEEAAIAVSQLREALALDRQGLPAQLKEDLSEVIDLFEIYIRCFSRIATVVFQGRRALATGEPGAAIKALENVTHLRTARDELATVLARRDRPHLLLEMMDPARLDGLMDDATRRLVPLCS